METPNKCRVSSGFTLVELSIVMIIIGLLIGGIFGGMKLIENANISKTVQDLKSVQSATYSFKDIYRAFPGDIKSPQTKISNCTTSPCSDAGDGNRSIGPNSDLSNVMALPDERFSFWHHLSAAQLLQLGVQNVNDSAFGVGQPLTSLEDGLRLMGSANGSYWGTTFQSKHLLITTNMELNSAITGPPYPNITCSQAQRLDQKIDDGMPFTGNFKSWGNCLGAETPVTNLNAPYLSNAVGSTNTLFFF